MNTAIFVTRAIPEAGIALLRSKGYSVDINPKDAPLSKRALIRALQKKPYDAVLCLLTDQIDREVFDAAPSVRHYANYATGYDNIDTVEASRRGIIVTNAPTEESAIAVAEHTIGLLLAVATKVVEADTFVRKGKFVGWSPGAFVGTRITGKTLGLVGCGAIGAKVALYARGLGMNVVYTDLHPNPTLAAVEGVTYCAELDTILREADAVSIHVPLLPATRHLIDETKLSIMKSTSFIINTARGAVIDEAALIRALEQKTIAGAALDVFEYEPKVAKRLRRCANTVLTPHIASASKEARDAMALIAAQSIIDHIEGRTPSTRITH